MRWAVVRLVSGVAATAPLLVVVAILVLIFGGFRSTTIRIVPIGVAAMIVSLVAYAAALGWFLYLVHHNRGFDSSDRARWTYILLLWFPFGAIAYWSRHVWRDTNTNQDPNRGGRI